MNDLDKPYAEKRARTTVEYNNGELRLYVKRKGQEVIRFSWWGLSAE